MNRSNRFISVGIVSLLLIFTVFCMVILSLLTYHTSTSDYISAKQALEQTDSYYNACTKVTDLALELNQQLKENLQVSSDYIGIFPSDIQKINLPDFVSYDASQNLFFIAVPFSETQELYAELEFHTSSTTDNFLSVKSWNSRLIGTWNPDLHQNVYLKGAPK